MTQIMRLHPDPFSGVRSIAEILQIDDSRPAYNFRPVVFPNEWQKSRRGATKPSSRGEAYRDYFQQLIDELRETHKFTGALAGQPQGWYVFASGFSGVVYGASFALGKRTRVELYIDRQDADANEQLFDWLFESRAAIEEEYGGDLEWERLDGKRACRIADYRDGSIDDSESTLQEIRAWHVEGLLRMKKVFDPRLRNYKA